MADTNDDLPEEAIRDALRALLGAPSPEQRDAMRRGLGRRVKAAQEERAVER